MQDKFNIQKSGSLAKLDRSKIGKIDIAIKPLVDAINARKDFYTTSSCSGRTVLLFVPKDEAKNKSRWVFSSHGIIAADSLGNTSCPEGGKSYLKGEPFILHVACRDLKAAKKLLDITNELGLKRSGITIGRKIKIEVMGNTYLSTLYAVGSKRLVAGEYLRLLVDECNDMMKKTREAINKLEKEIKLLR